MRFVLTCLLVCLLAGCSPLSALLPTKPAVEASLEVDASEGKVENYEAVVGADTVIDTKSANISTTVNGFAIEDLTLVLSVLLLLVVGLVSAFGYGTYHIGLRTPRPDKYRRTR